MFWTPKFDSNLGDAFVLDWRRYFEMRDAKLSNEFFDRTY